MRKYFPHVLALGLFLCAAVLLGAVFEMRKQLEVAHAAISAQEGQITGQKDVIQKANSQLGVAEANLISKDSVLSQYKKDIESMGIEIADLRTKVNAKPVSRDSSTIVIEKIVSGGKQEVVTGGGITNYNWVDPTGRFRLTDPDIASSGDERFSYKLKVRITGYILEDDTGTIKARQVVAQELIEKTNPDGTVSVIVGERLPIENNIYQYSLPSKEPAFLDIFRPRLFALFDTSLNPGIGVELLNFGNYFEYVNIGIAPYLSAEVADFPNKLSGSLIGIGVQYTVIPPLLSTNIGIGVGIATPADEFLDRFLVTGNLIFYLTN
jgi:hypothetical protein